VVVSPDLFNERNEDVVLAAVSSQLSSGMAVLSLDRSEVCDGWLPRDSVVRFAKIFTLHSGLINKRLCRLKAEKRACLLTEMRAFFQ